MKKTLSALLLSAALMTPVMVKAADDHNRDGQNRFYDQDYRDYHQWNDHEERAYREYLKERRREYRGWSKMDRKEQKEYWRWRHKHPDAVIFRDEH